MEDLLSISTWSDLWFFFSSWVSILSSVPWFSEACLILLLFLGSALNVLIPEICNWTKEKFWRQSVDVVERRVTVHLSPTSVGVLSDRNALLQNALFFYLRHHFWRTPLPLSFWHNKTALLLLIDPLRSAWRESYDSPFRMDGIEENDGTGVESMNWRSQKKLMRYLLVKVPTQGSWITVGEDGIELTYEREREIVSSAEGVRRTIVLRATGGRKAAESVEKFMQRALDYYISHLPDVMHDGRAYLELQPPLRNNSNDARIFFKRYPLNKHKTFDTLFFPEKHRILKLVDDFMGIKGRFATEGFPLKLGFLLYGPPGTGKTSFVKALAAYTRRHVVSVQLPFLQSNQNLCDIFLNRMFQCVGESECRQIAMDDLIFLLDDVDASNPIVRSRVRRRCVQKPASAAIGVGEENARVSIASPVGGKRGVEAAMDSDEDGNGDEVTTDVSIGLVNELVRNALAAHSCDRDGLSAAGKRLQQEALHNGSLLSLLASSNAPNLSGLLNVLDGAVDTPGRIVVMIANNPERLDSALVRPGRFSTRLRLDYIRMPALLDMLGLHFGSMDNLNAKAVESAGGISSESHGSSGADVTWEMPLSKLSNGDVTRVREAIAALNGGDNGNEDCVAKLAISPAEVEAMCTVSETLGEFLQHLHSRCVGLAK